MYGIISYIILSELAALLDTTVGAIAFIVSLTVFLLGLGVLVWILVRRQAREKRKMESTLLLPSIRAGELRKKYLR